jgi:hypothetical protein
MSEATLQTVLAALTGLKDEIATLRTDLHAARDRIVRLEQATYTPSNLALESGNTPLVSVREGNSPIAYGRLVLGWVWEAAARASEGASFLQPTSNITNEAPEADFRSNPTQSSKPTADHPSEEIAHQDICSPTSPCDLQQHIKPINASLATVTVQLSRIEEALGISSSSENCVLPGSPSRTSHNTSVLPEILTSLPHEEEEPLPTPSNEKLSSNQNPSKLSMLPPCVLTNIHTDSQTQESLPVFGTPSAPHSRRPITSVDISRSPFSKYSDERSPFAQIVKQENSAGGAGGVFGTGHSTFPVLKGLSLSSDKPFGTSTVTDGGE